MNDSNGDPEGLEVVRVVTARGVVDVLAADQPQTGVRDGVTTLQFSIGARAPMRCFLYPEEIGTAETVADLVAGMAKAASIEFDAVVPRAVAVVRSAPVLFVGAPYRTQRGGSALRGELNLAVHPHPTRPALCMHDEPGRRETFERSATRLFASPGRAETSPAASVEVRRVTLGGLLVGFERLAVATNANGLRTVTSTRAFVVPRDGGGLTAEDAISDMTVDSQGGIVTGSWVKVSGKEVEYSLRLTREDGTYKYSGEKDGRVIGGEFRAKDARGVQNGDLFLETLARSAARDGAVTLETEEYVPGADATRPLTVRYSRSQDDRAGQYSVAMPGMNVRLRIDAAGRLLRMSAAVGGRELVIEPVDEKRGP